MSGLRLPPGLVDLVLARTGTASGRTTAALSGSLWQAAARKQAHSVVTLKPRIPSPSYAEDSHSLYAAKAPRKEKEKGRERAVAPFGLPQPRAVSTLEERVNALKNTVVEEADLDTHVFYEEEHLLALYEDLLALPQEPQPDAQAEPKQPEEDPLPVVQKIAERLLPDVSEPSTSAVAAQPLHYALIEQLEQAQADLEATEAALKKASAPATNSEVAEATPDVPVVLLSQKEWTALVSLCVRQRDTDAAERVLALMQRAECGIPEESFNSVLAIHARAGDVSRANAFVSKFLSVSPTQQQRHLHVRAHLEAIPETAFPTDALRLLHDYESRALFPPQKTYSRLIRHLLSARSSIAHAHAWDLFAHMRYVAHPTPDAHMYTTMIRACASNAISPDGEPERALDLFTEMTVDNGIAPTAGAYIATILACARSGRKKYVHEGFRLAKEMMDAYRDAYGQSQFLPGQRFFTALLEGAKRIGDLARVRWILAEMVRESVVRDESGTEQVDARRAVHEEVMMHVFHAYAAYRPPFHRSLAPKAPGDGAQAATDHQEVPPEAPQPEADTDSTDVVPEPEPEPTFAPLPPQSHAEVVQEAQVLYARVQADRARGQGAFAHVVLSPRLVNAYLSVHYAHAPLEVWRPLFHSAHADAGVPRNPHTYVDVLERCAHVKKPERAAALQLAEEVFPEWAALEAGWRAAGPQEVAAHARLIERAHAAMIRIRTLGKNLAGALDAVRAFVAAYPPEWLRAPAERPPFRSTRTNLLGARPLVRVFHAVDIPDDGVPPLLAFAELEVLHHRLVAAGAAADVRYLTWVCKAYQGSLRRRREKALRATMHPVHKPAPPAL